MSKSKTVATKDDKNIAAIKKIVGEDVKIEIIADGIYSAGDQFYTTKGGLNNNYKPLLIGSEDNGRGLGDTLESVFKITSIKALVGIVKSEADCGCDKRKKFLNEKFPSAQPNCMNESQYNEWDRTKNIIQKTDQVTPEDQGIIIKLLLEIFNMSIAPCGSCGSSIWKKYIQMLDVVFNSYKNKNLI